MTPYYRLFQIFDKPIIILGMEQGQVRIIDANEAFSRLLGYTLEEIKSKESAGHLLKYNIDVSKQSLKSELGINTKQNKQIPVRVDQHPIPKEPGETELLCFVVFEDLTAFKWIEQKCEQNKVIISGIVDAHAHIRFLRDSVAPLLFEPDKKMEDETILSFIADSEHVRLMDALSEAGTMKKEKSLTLQTSRLSGIELELSITFTPIFDGFGETKEYAFVIWDLKPIDDSIDSSMKLKIWMAKRDMTAGMLSEATGISMQTISKLRNGKILRPQRLTAELIASELRVDVHDIWTKIGK
ncbi:helix-turn-helix domain-containing protein [Paenibacillus harenae]|uniref:DNA-binding Xre family transcriptional regulator n=1 Tax=Paenibacillus harenae TaxID=306543 RepID=A0ABT9TY54_PAEHA|nr:helix-turn-helix domain-containing protein [Paenibacillus harenae]MDQ0058338.1 DNA-binding Xre family transcriptional regulator [Paenibacillus harenae]MDQ0111683.1 DNA-binding Xre family transcriptional regulator [Paenibacillus harenae]